MATADLHHISADLDGVGHLLRDLALSVPPYQRPYSWEDEQVETFWNDLYGAMQSVDRSYFLGTVVLAGTKTARARTIIDGQQRLATTALLFAAIRDLFKQMGDAGASEVIENDYLSQRTLTGSDRVARLKLNTQDADYFEQNILKLRIGLDLAVPGFPSNANLARAYTLLREKMHGLLAIVSDWRDELRAWVDFLESGARVIVVEVQSDADAFLVFETLNDRGLPLSVADLLKNHIFKLIETDRESIERDWLSAVAALDSPDGAHYFLDFLRQYWSSIHGATRERDLYKSMRRSIRSDAHAVAFCGQLKKASQNYLALITGDAGLWPTERVSADAAASQWRLKLSQNRPMLLAAMDCFSGEELSKLVENTVSWGLRGLIVGSIGGGTAEQAYCDAAVEIRKGKAQNSEEVFSLIRRIVPSDEVFSSAMQSTYVNRQFLAKYVLSCFDRLLANRPKPALVEPEFESGATLIRVAREDVSDLWPEFQKNDAMAQSYRLAAFVLVEKALARKILAATQWAEIREFLSVSTHPAARELAKEPVFTPDTLRSRQRIMAEQARTIWPILAH